MISYIMILVHNDRSRTVQIDISNVLRIYQFEHLVIVNCWNDRLGYRLGLTQWFVRVEDGLVELCERFKGGADDLEVVQMGSVELFDHL